MNQQNLIILDHLFLDLILDLFTDCFSPIENCYFFNNPITFDVKKKYECKLNPFTFPIIL